VRAELLDLIAGLRDRLETTILLTTHYLDEAERLCDRLAIMHEGKIVALDTPHALRADLGEKIVELRVRDQPAAALDGCVTAAWPDAMRSPLEPRSRSRSTTTTTPSRPPRSSGRGSHRPRSRPASQRSTTSTCD
jgi:ABC-2 type transport system ATP-binding protein